MENEPVKRVSAKSWKFSKDFLKNDVWGGYWKVRDLINNIKAPNLILKLLDRINISQIQSKQKVADTCFQEETSCARIRQCKLNTENAYLKERKRNSSDRKTRWYGFLIKIPANTYRYFCSSDAE